MNQKEPNSSSSSSIENIKIKNEDNDDYEETIVFVSFPEFENNPFLLQSQQITLTGLDGPNPRCNVEFGDGRTDNNNYLFYGKYNVNLGTQMLFSLKDIDSGSVDAKLLSKCDRRIKFEIMEVPGPKTTAEFKIKEETLNNDSINSNKRRKDS